MVSNIGTCLVMHKIAPFFITPFLFFLFSHLFAGNVKTFRAAKQISIKMRTLVFGGLSGDVNAAEEMIKEYIPEDMRMCDVTYPRYLNCLVEASIYY